MIAEMPNNDIVVGKSSSEKYCAECLECEHSPVGLALVFALKPLVQFLESQFLQFVDTELDKLPTLVARVFGEFRQSPVQVDKAKLVDFLFVR